MTKHIDGILLSLLLVLLTAFFLFGCGEKQSGDKKTNAENTSDTSNSETTATKETLTASISAPSDTVQSPVTAETTEAAAESVAETVDESSYEKVDASAFDNSLFIGDSRTVGLSQYADLGAADVFAASGLNVFRITEESVGVDGIGNISLEALLNTKKYDKIFIMLGINEIGYNHSFVIKKYGDLLEKIKVICPETKIFLCANLHIIQKRSQSDSVYNNIGVNEINEGIKNYADGTRVFYIDVNPLFDDENGALNEAYTIDDFHLVGKYYDQWGRWLAAQVS